MVERDFLPSKKVGDFFNSNFIFLNCPSGQKINKIIESKYGVGSHPTFLYLDGDGKEIARFSGAANDEDKFIEKIAFYAKKENSQAAQKKRFLEDESYGEKYIKYINDAYLRDEFEFAYNTVFDRLKGNKEKQVFLKKNLNGMALFYFKSVNGSIFNYMYNNKEEFKEIMGLDDEKYEGNIFSVVSGCIKNMLVNFEYNEKDYQRLLEIFKQYPRLKKYNELQFKALKPAKEKGLDGIVDVYEKEVFKLSPMERQIANYIFYNNFTHMIEKNARLRKYIEKCYETDKNLRAGRLYKGMLGIEEK